MAAGDPLGEEDIFNQPFSVEEVTECIKKLKCGKSCGVDNILNEFLKYGCSKKMISCLTMFFNVVLSSGIAPSQWSIGLIKPVFKGNGSPSEPKNFCPITLLSCAGKVFTAIVRCLMTGCKFLSMIIGSE